MKIKSILLFASVLATAVSLPAQSLISFTFSGTADSGSGLADSDNLGYTEGQAVSFTFIMADNSPILDADGQNSVRWEDWGQSSQRLIQSVSGTGITGTWLAPVVEDDEGPTYNSYFSVEHLPEEGFNLSVKTFDFDESPVNIGGLKANGYDLGQIMIEASDENPLGFGTLPSSGSPFDLLTASIGSYDLSGSPLSASIFEIGEAGDLNFTITNVTISAYSAVPEPSTYAAIFGALALVGTICLRRRSKANA